MSAAVTPFSVATVIVNYGAGHLVKKHLAENLDAHKGASSAKIYIVDNASPNGDGEMLADHISQAGLEDQVILLRERENLGFAKGNNVALRMILASDNPPDYIFLLNPDAYLIGDCLDRLASFLQSNAKAGIAGAKLVGPDDRAQISAFRFFSIASEFAGAARTGIFSRIFSNKEIAPDQRDETFEIDWVCGAAMLIRREVFADTGLFDEAYFLYYEETDFMLQAARTGWRTWYVHDACAVHLVGQSTGVKDGRAEAKVSPRYVFESRRHYFRKNHHAAYAVLADIAWLAGSLWFWSTRRIMGRKTDYVGMNIKAFLDERFSKRDDNLSAPTESSVL